MALLFTLGQDFELGASYLGGEAPPAVYDGRAATFFVAELDAYVPTTGATDTLRVSDLGYRTRSGDAGGVLAYPGLLDTAFEIDRRISLDPAQASTATYGAFRITNLGGIFDVFTLSRNGGDRPVRLLIGQKGYDPSRGIYLDPPYDGLRPIFTGAAGPWLVAEDVVTVPLQDATYLADKALQSRLFGGAGKLDGTPDLAGKPKPMTRGGTPAAPVLNAPLVLIDPIQNIWQWTDGPGTVQALYEGGAQVFASAGDVPDLYAGSTPPGAYRTCNALGLLQLGSTPVRVVTADVTGAGPSTAIALARYVLTADLAFPAGFLDGGSFTAADLAYPCAAGFFVGAAPARGLDLVRQLVGSVTGRLLSARDGYLGVFVLAPLTPDTPPAAVLDTSNVISVAPAALPAALDPPPHRWQVGWGANNNVQTADFDGDLPPARKAFLAAATRLSTWTGDDVTAAWLRPGEPAALATLLLLEGDARRIAQMLGDRWRLRPGCFTVVLPLTVAAGLSIGDAVRLAWPLGPLAAGALVQIVGEQVRSYDATITFEVLLVDTPALAVLYGGRFPDDDAAPAATLQAGGFDDAVALPALTAGIYDLVS